MDAVDRRIVETLQGNARMTNADLARAIGLAASSTLERVRRLEERGVIRSYRAVLDPQALGWGLAALVCISLDRHQAGAIDDFEGQVRAIPEVRCCHHLTGRWDYALQVVVRDVGHLGELLKHGLGALPGIEKLETSLVLSTVKEDEGLPLPGSAAREG